MSLEGDGSFGLLWTPQLESGATNGLGRSLFLFSPAASLVAPPWGYCERLPW